MAKIHLRIGYQESEETIHLQLEKITDIATRNKNDKEVNASLTMAVYPICKEPYLLRQKTKVFYKTNNILFSEKVPAKQGQYSFQLPTHSFDADQTVVEFALYHTIPYTFQKVFHSLATIPLGTLQYIRDSDELIVSCPKIILYPSKISHVDTEEYKELKTRKDKLSKIFLDRYDRQRLEKNFFESQEWAKIDASVRVRQLVASHLEELVEFQRDLKEKGNGQITMRIVFHEKLEKLIIEGKSVENVAPLSGDRDTNLCIGIRILPTAAKEMTSRIYSNTTAFQFEERENVFTLDFKDVSYNYHNTYVQIICYIVIHHSLMSSKKWCERLFCGHVLLPLSDIPPIDDQDKMKNVSFKKYPFQKIKTFDSPIYDSIAEEKDKMAKEYVENLKKFRDGLGVKIPYRKDEWAECQATLPILKVVANCLNKQTLLSGEEIEHSGNLRYSIGYFSSKRLLKVELKSISDISPLKKDKPCDISIAIVVLPLPKSPHLQKVSTPVYKDCTSGLLFDLVSDESIEPVSRHSWWISPSKAGGVPTSIEKNFKFQFDLSDQNISDANDTYVMFELFFHSTSGRHFAGSFQMSLASVIIVKDLEDCSRFFKSTPAIEDLEEFNELEARTGETETKRILKHLRKRNGNFLSALF